MFSTKLLHIKIQPLLRTITNCLAAHITMCKLVKNKLIRKLGNQPVKVKEIIITISIIIFTKGIKETVYVLQDSSQFATEIIHPFIQAKKKKRV